MESRVAAKVALRYLALTLAETGLDQQVDLAQRLDGWVKLGRLLPIFLPLLPLAKQLATDPARHGSADDLCNYIVSHLEPQGSSYEGLAAAVHSELEAGRVLLLLDGLDEVAGDTSRRQVREAVQAFATLYIRCRIVVSCRVRAYEGEQNAQWQLPGWHTSTLADWTLGQMVAFVKAWHSAAATAGGISEQRRAERTASLQRALRVRSDLQRLGVRPLLLTIMALVHLNDGKLPEDRVGLYSRCLDLLLGQWEIAGKDASDYGTLMDYIGLPDGDVKSLRPLLSRAAFRAHEASTSNSPGHLSRTDLREMVMEELAKHKHSNPYKGAQRFLDYTDVRAGLLQASEAGDAYAFPHQTFQEYLAGLELVRGIDFVKSIMQHRDDDRWRVPILLGVGHSVSEGLLALPCQLLGELLEREGRDEAQRQRDLLLAAEIADDVGWERLEQGGDTFKRLRRSLASAVAQVVEGTALPAAERVRAGVLLGQLGDTRPSVCSLPPAMVELPGGAFQIGITHDELAAVIQAQPDEEQRKLVRQGLKSALNDKLISVKPFAIARYPVTNAQFALFMADDGYNTEQPWWDTPGVNGSNAMMPQQKG